MLNYIYHSVLILSVYICAFYAQSSHCMPHMYELCLCSVECIRCLANQIEHALLAVCYWLVALLH